jgi:FMN-dependent NADH-azoreductase
MKKILYVESCINVSSSRTARLAKAYLAKRLTAGDAEVETVVLEDADLQALNTKSLSYREQCIRERDFSDPLFDFAKSFAAADELVIAAPFWDFSFPSMLKIYLESICVRDLTFCYTETGSIANLTKISSVTYITTAGGYIDADNCGCGYIKKLCSGLFGVKEFRFINAQGLDIYGNDPEKLLAQAIEAI